MPYGIKAMFIKQTNKWMNQLIVVLLSGTTENIVESNASWHELLCDNQTNPVPESNSPAQSPSC